MSNQGETTILGTLAEVAALEETEGGPIIVHGSASSVRDPSGPDRSRSLQVHSRHPGRAPSDRQRVVVAPEFRPG